MHPYYWSWVWLVSPFYEVGCDEWGFWLNDKHCCCCIYKRIWSWDLFNTVCDWTYNLYNQFVTDYINNEDKIIGFAKSNWWLLTSIALMLFSLLLYLLILIHICLALILVLKTISRITNLYKAAFSCKEKSLSYLNWHYVNL